MKTFSDKTDDLDFLLNPKNFLKSKNDKILYPGEKEWLEETNRQKNGIPFDLELIQLYLKICKKYKVNLF